MTKELNNNKNYLIALSITSIFIEILACLLGLIPIVGFIIYPFVSGFAIVLNIISFILSKNSKIIRIINSIISIVLILTIIEDIVFLLVMCVLSILD